MPIVPRPPRARLRFAATPAILLLVAGACAATPSPATTPATSPLPSPTTDATEGPSPCPPRALAPAEGPWWADAVVYEVFVRSFADSDADGIGDLRGLTARLDYLNDGDPSTSGDLGVTAVWLMPVAESPSYHGYDVVDYRTVEADYGSNDDFTSFVAAAHDRGIRVIVDFVVNHTSVDHPWFAEARAPGSARDAWYVWADDPPAWNGPDGQRVWHAAGDRVYYGFFWEGMPDLDLTNPAVTAELEAVAAYWLDEMGVDGFRIDAAQHLVEDGPEQVDTPATHAWLAGFRDAIHATDPDALVLGEVFNTRLVTSSYIDTGSLDLVFDFDLAGTLRNAARLGDAGSVLASLADLPARYPSGGYATFLSNHDQNRVMSELRGDAAAARSAAAMLLTAPGVPVLYYGEEVGLEGRKPDPDIRTPLPWTAELPGRGFTDGTPWAPFAPGADAATIAGQDADVASLLSSYRLLVGLRTTHAALATGDLVAARASSPSVAAWLRRDPLQTLLVVHNLADEDLADVRLSLPAGALCGVPETSLVAFVPRVAADIEVDLRAPTVGPDGSVADYAPLEVLPARSSWVIRLDP